jgi:hypothetical protein
MFLKHALIENVGPIERLDLELPFRDGRPLPLILVGPNGSGKSTLLSFIVNALVAFKQQVYENAEIESGKVFRIRSGIALRHGTAFYHAHLQFEQGFSTREWVLDRPRSRFETEVTPHPTDGSWKQIPPDDFNRFATTPEGRNPLMGRPVDSPLGKAMREHVVLYFPSDRFEPPDWLNEGALSPELRFPAANTFHGQTDRRIFAKSLLKPTLEWLRAVILDHLVGDRRPLAVQAGPQVVEVFQLADGPNRRLINTCARLLAAVFGLPGVPAQLLLNGRGGAHFALQIGEGAATRTIPNLLSLSAGQSALFCLFANILRDADLTGQSFSGPDAIRGIVVIDEVDLHLHVGLQHDVLPELIRLFPNVQFVITTHSPLFVMGMAKQFGEDGFRLAEMPSGTAISPEAYSEFVSAFEAFARTQSFVRQVMTAVRATDKPVILVEGKTDAAHLRVAWGKLYPDRELPYLIVPCGGEESGGGAKTLKAMLEAMSAYESRPILGLFDNDREGAEQFNSLKKKGFIESGSQSLRHQKGAIRSLVLTPPPGREAFAPEKIAQRVLELEHFYADETLRSHGAAGDGIYGSAVFEIDKSAKVPFSDQIDRLDSSQFEAFRLLFTAIESALTPTENAAAGDSRS